jgi:hypothetical protein
VTNILLQFIVTPRADPKRFEMLSLLATILSWEDGEREKAGLQRVGGGGGPSGLRRKTSDTGSPAKSNAKGKEKENAPDTYNEVRLRCLRVATDIVTDTLAYTSVCSRFPISLSSFSSKKRHRDKSRKTRTHLHLMARRTHHQDPSIRVHPLQNVERQHQAAVCLALRDHGHIRLRP